MYPRLFQTGPLLIPTYGVAAAVALICGLLLAMRSARAIGVDPDAVWNLGLVAVCSAFLGSRLLLVAGNWRDFLRFPLLMLTAAPLNSGKVFYGGLVFGVAAGLLYSRRKGLPLLRVLDAFAPGFALGYGILMLGCLAGGSCYGMPTGKPWGITFHSRFAALWSGTPLGIPLQPTQIYEAGAEFLICALLLWMLRQRSRTAGRSQDGEVFGAWLFLGGAAHFIIEFYRADPGRGSLFSGLITLTQGIALIAIIEGGLLWMDRTSRRKPAAYALQ